MYSKVVYGMQTAQTASSYSNLVILLYIECMLELVYYQTTDSINVNLLLQGAAIESFE